MNFLTPDVSDMEKTYVDEAWVHWVHWVELHVRESRILNADSESGCISFL